jgi:hypothetical protein
MVKELQRKNVQVWVRINLSASFRTQNIFAVTFILLLTKYYTGDISRRMRWAGHVARMADKRDAYMVLVGKETACKAGVVDWIILKRIFNNFGGCVGLD